MTRPKENAPRARGALRSALLIDGQSVAECCRDNQAPPRAPVRIKPFTGGARILIVDACLYYGNRRPHGGYELVDAEELV